MYGNSSGDGASANSLGGACNSIIGKTVPPWHFGVGPDAMMLGAYGTGAV